MIHFESFQLPNGLQVFVHSDFQTPMAAFNICYNVGSRDEDPKRTGFAHLFEHLMFGGSVNIPSYDEPLQRIGAENNAFTSPDITNYYITLPAVNLETAFWLESDRMLGLSFDPKVLEVQQKVVIEEFKQRYLNQPYGDVWLKARPLAYQVHPYQWATIGKDISHIEEATMDDVRTFFFQHYAPNNAVLVVAGPVTKAQVEEMAKKWFGDIPHRPIKPKSYALEPIQQTARHLKVEAAVPMSQLMKMYAMPGRYQEGYLAMDLFGDLIGRGKSSRFHQKLVKELELFHSVSAFTMGSLDPGLWVISGHVNPGVSLEEADEAVQKVLTETLQQPIPAAEVEKVKVQAETSLVYSEVELLNRAMNLAFAANAGDPAYCQTESEKIQALTPQQIQQLAQELLQPERCSTLHYQAVAS